MAAPTDTRVRGAGGAADVALDELYAVLLAADVDAEAVLSSTGARSVAELRQCLDSPLAAEHLPLLPRVRLAGVLSKHPGAAPAAAPAATPAVAGAASAGRTPPPAAPAAARSAAGAAAASQPSPAPPLRLAATGPLGPRGCRVEVCRGNLVAQTTDAIVNAANGQLWLGGGVAGAIAQADRSGEIQRQCQAFIQGPNRGRDVPTGQVAHTDGGSLACCFVIHAVGPRCATPGQPSDTEARLLGKAISNALRKAEELGCTSVALPMLSTGIFGFPKERAAPLFVKHSLKRAKETGVLQVIRLVNIDEESTALLQTELARATGPAPHLGSQPDAPAAPLTDVLAAPADVASAAASTTPPSSSDGPADEPLPGSSPPASPSPPASTTAFARHRRGTRSARSSEPTTVQVISNANEAEFQRRFRAGGILPVRLLSDGRAMVLMAGEQRVLDAGSSFRARLNLLGGRRDNGDADFQHTAVREFQEETMSLAPSDAVRRRVHSAHAQTLWLEVGAYCLVLIPALAEMDSIPERYNSKRVRPLSAEADWLAWVDWNEVCLAMAEDEPELSCTAPESGRGRAQQKRVQPSDYLKRLFAVGSAFPAVVTRYIRLLQASTALDQVAEIERRPESMAEAALGRDWQLRLEAPPLVGYRLGNRT